MRLAVKAITPEQLAEFIVNADLVVPSRRDLDRVLEAADRHPPRGSLPGADQRPRFWSLDYTLKGNAALKLSVEGHTDSLGNAKFNQALSQKRAESVKKYLVGKGADAKRLEARGWGDTKPVSDNRTEDGRAKNRRVELVKK